MISSYCRIFLQEHLQHLALLAAKWIGKEQEKGTFYFSKMIHPLTTISRRVAGRVILRCRVINPGMAVFRVFQQCAGLPIGVRPIGIHENSLESTRRFERVHDR